MWSLKILSGEWAGQAFPLKMGTNVVGRAPHCDVVIENNGISKEHAQIEVYNDKIIINDLKSRNGTFINGVQVKSQKVRPGDKVTLFDVLIEIAPQAQAQQRPSRSQSRRPSTSREQQFEQPYVHPGIDGNVAYDQNYNPQQNGQPTATPQTNFFAHLKQYLDEVVLPGSYKLLEWFEFRWVIGFFVVGFIVFVTAMSTVPLIRILKSSIEKESQYRAMTIARTIASQNQSSISQGRSSMLDIRFAQRESGVKNAYIISSGNGHVLAPSEFAGQPLTSVPSVATAQKLGKENVEQVDDSTIVAVVPIFTYQASIGQPVVSAYSVIVYEMDPVDGARTLSLFIQVLFIAILFGGLLYFFMVKIIEQPIVEMNQQVVAYLKNGSGQLGTRFQFSQMQKLITSVSSAISRASGGFAGDQMQTAEADRSLEALNMLNLIGFPAMAIQASDRVVMNVNEHFHQIMGHSTNWPGLPLSQVLDMALKLNLQNLVERVIQNPTQPTTDHIDINSYTYDLTASAVLGSKDVAYVIVTFVQKAGGTG